MKSLTLNLLLVLLVAGAYAQDETTASSPDQKLKLYLKISAGVPYYRIDYNGKAFLDDSPLGLVSSLGDFSKGLRMVNHSVSRLNETYTLNRSKVSHINYQANELKCGFTNAAHDTIYAIFRLTNTDAVFSYLIPQNGKGPINCTVEKETTGFNFPAGTTTFITPQATAG